MSPNLQQTGSNGLRCFQIVERIAQNAAPRPFSANLFEKLRTKQKPCTKRKACATAAIAAILRRLSDMTHQGASSSPAWLGTARFGLLRHGSAWYDSFQRCYPVGGQVQYRRLDRLLDKFRPKNLLVVLEKKKLTK